MPVLPDVRQQYGTNLGQPIDTSGEEQNAKVYGAIGQFSSQVGEFATQVARDINLKAANLEKSQKLAQYETQRQTLLDTMSRDPNLDFVNNSKQIEEDYRNTLRSSRESILTNAQSGMAKEMMEQSLASAEPEEALSLLKLKNEKINNALKIELSKAEEDYSSSLLSPNTDFNLANDNFKKTINRISSVYGSYYTPEVHQKYQQNIADIGAQRSMSTMLMSGRTQEAAAQLLGSNYSLLLNHMKTNFKNGVDTYMGVGLRDETRPGYYKVHLPNGTIVDFDSKNEEQWKKASFMLSKEFSRMSENVFIDSTPTNEIIRNSSPETKSQMFNSLFKALYTKPKEDTTIATKVANDFNKLATRGKVTKDHIDSVMAPEVLSNLNKGQQVEVASSLVVQAVQDIVNRIPREKISEQETILKEVEKFMETLPTTMKDDKNYQTVAAYVGDGDTEKGLEVLKQDIMSKVQRDAFLEAAERRRIELKTEFEKDPISTARKSIGESAQATAIRRKLFADGAIKKINGLTPDEYAFAKNEHTKIKSEVTSLGDAFGLTENVVDKDTENAIREAFRASYSDTGELTAIVDNLKKIYGDLDFAQLMVQVEQPDMVMALANSNLDYIGTLSRANKWFDSYKRTTMTKEGQEPALKEIYDAMAMDKSLNNYLNISMNYMKSSSPLVAKAMKENVKKVALYNMKQQGLYAQDSVDAAVKSLIGNNNELLKHKDGFFSDNKEYSVIVDKAHKLTSDDIKEAFDGSVGNIDWVRRQSFALPKEMQSKDGETYTRARFEKMITENATVINASNVDGFILGFRFADKNGDKKFIPLMTAEGEEALLPISEVKRMRDENKKKEEANSFLNKVIQMTGAVKDIFSTPAEVKTKAPQALTPPKSPITFTPTTYKLLTKNRSTDHFINSPMLYEINTLQRRENANMAKNFNKVILNHGTTTLGGAMTAAALKDAADALKIPYPKNKESKSLVEYFASTIKTKADYDKLFIKYMQINRNYIREELKGLPEYKKATLADLAWTLGANAIKKSGVVELFRDPSKTTEDIYNHLLSANMKISSDSNKTVSEIFKENFTTEIKGVREKNRRLREILAWK